MKKITTLDAQSDIDTLKKEDLIMRKLNKYSWPDLRPYTSEIIAWAHAKGGSKYKIQRLLSARHADMKNVSADRIYRFVLDINGGVWPNSKKKMEDK